MKLILTSTCTEPRTVRAEAKIKSVYDRSRERFKGLKTSVTGSYGRGHVLCDSGIPKNLRLALFKGYLTAARVLNTAERTKAMINIGHCMINAFGTRYDVSEAMVWFGRAGMEGSITGQEMVFRLERLMKQSATELVLGLDKRTHVNWMVTCLLHNLGPANLTNPLPLGIHLEKPQTRLREVLLGFELELVEKGLQRAVNDYIVRVLTMNKRDYSHAPAWEIFPEIWTAITRDDSIPIDNLLTANDPKFSASVKEALILSAAEERAVNILRSLIYDHKLHLAKSFEIALVRAFQRSDMEIGCLLINLGVPGAAMLSSNALNSVITGSTIPTIEIALGLFEMVQVEEETTEYLPYFHPVVLRRETVDGIQPIMNYEAPGRETIDNYPPPIFETVTHNRHINLWLILSAGGNPNVRYLGMTALHLAVKMLRPLLVAFLLAFGADPNARDFRSRYETPLHQMSGPSAYPLPSKDEYYNFCDIFGDKFAPAPAYPDEDNHHRRLIIRLLLEYGADLNSLCADSMTPLMSAIISPEPHASTIAKYLMELGADPLKTGPMGLTAIHMASMKGSLQILRHLLYIPGHALLNQPSSVGATPLMAACGSAGRERHVIELLEAGADITIRNSDGLNALSVAMCASQKTIFDILINHVEQLPARFRDAVLLVNPVCGVTAACDAFGSKNNTTVTYFLQKLIPLMNDPHRANNGGITPLHIAVIKKMIPAMKILLENGADVNTKSRYGMTPLHLAYGLREQTLVNLLLSWKADTGIRNDFGLTPEEFGFTARSGLGITIDRYLEELTRVRSDAVEEPTISQDDDLKSDQHRKRLVEESEYVANDRFALNIPGSSRSITEIEDVHLKVLELAISKHGERHRDSLWKMNNLGCVYERYGRLTKAEDIYRRGWKLSLSVLGSGNVLTKDFANKLMRVLSDLDRASDGKEVAQWISRFGRDTLTPPLIRFHIERDKEILNNLVHCPEPETVGRCDRVHCNKPSQLICQGK